MLPLLSTKSHNSFVLYCYTSLAHTDLDCRDSRVRESFGCEGPLDQWAAILLCFVTYSSIGQVLESSQTSSRSHIPSYFRHAAKLAKAPLNLCSSVGRSSDHLIRSCPMHSRQRCNLGGISLSILCFFYRPKTLRSRELSWRQKCFNNLSLLGCHTILSSLNFFVLGLHTFCTVQQLVQLIFSQPYHKPSHPFHTCH